MDAIEKRARELLAQQVGPLEVGGVVNASGDLFLAEVGVVQAIIAALTPPEGYVLVPVEERQDAKRFRWLKTCSKEQYLLARGVFGLAEDVIDAAIQSEEMEARNG